MKVQSAVLSLGLVLGALPAAGQVVRHELVDRMTDKREPRIMVPEQRGGAMSVLILDCRIVVIGRFPGRDVAQPVDTDYLTRLDRAPPVKGRGTLAPDHYFVLESSTGPSELRGGLHAAKTLAVRVGDRDIEYKLAEDNAEAFSLTVDMHGGSGIGARAAWGVLDATLKDAAQGRNGSVAALMKKLGIALVDGTRQRSVAEVMPAIVRGFKINRGRPVAADMGRALFGPGWDDVAPYVLNADDYAADNGSAESQTEWLAQQCSAGKRL